MQARWIKPEIYYVVEENFPAHFYAELSRTDGQRRELYSHLAFMSELALPAATHDVRFLAEADFEAHEARVYSIGLCVG